MVRLARLRAPERAAEPVSAARNVAYRTVRRVNASDAFADQAFRAEAERARLDPRDRAFAQQLAYGTVQRRSTLDYVLSGIASRPTASIDPDLRDLLRLGIFQLVYLDGVPDHAAVNETVEMAKAECGRGHRFANALMRRAAREARDLVAELGTDSPAEAAIVHSHPEWLVRMWWEELGPEETLALLPRNNQAAESALRANELLVTVEEVTAALGEAGVRTHAAPHLAEGVVLETPFDMHGSPLWASGAYMPQSRAAMLVGRVMDPRPGERVLDLCAAPGGKTTHMAALMEGSGQIVSVERQKRRAEQLQDTCRQMAAGQVQVIQGDAAVDAPGERFDRVLLDPPCSDLGTLQARPDVRWRKSLEQVERVASLQSDLLDAAAPRVAAGGTLVYSTCTISASENERQVEAFVARHPEFEADDLAAHYPDYAHPGAPRMLRLMPHRHGTDGFFIARLRRAA